MSKARAIEEAKRLKEIMAKHGVEAVIDLGIGRPNVAGDDWYTRKVAVMNHHTAGPKRGLTPTLGLVKRGRSDLPGPLANGYGGRDHIYRILTMGLANHPGEGGPLTLAGKLIPKDSARISVWGTEWEHDGLSPWDPAMQEFMGRSNAALLEWMDRPVEVVIEHKTWAPGRKPDRNNYSQDGRDGQREVERFSLPKISASKVRHAFDGNPLAAPVYVARVQRLLREKGFLTAKVIKGRAGRTTREAWMAYEVSIGHAANAKPSRDELERLARGRFRIVD